MSSSDHPIPSTFVLAVRAMFRGALHLLPIAVALAIVAWWSRPAAERPPAAVASTPKATPERSLSEAIERAKASTVTLEYGSGAQGRDRRAATGVVVSDRGDVLSVRVDPPEGRDRGSILARDAAGHRHPVRWVAADPETGLTLLRVEADDIRPIRPAARAAILGASVFLIGNPYGLGHSVSRGNVAGLARRMAYGPRPLGGLVHIQMSLHPGDSGALLADMEGNWLGLVRGGLVPSPGAKDDNNLGFAIPAADALWIAEQLRDHNRVDRAFLGIRLEDESTAAGAEVASVIESSPAQGAGLRARDRIVRLDDQPIRNPDDLTDRLDRTAAGSNVVVEFVRGSALDHLTLKTAVRPPLPSVEPPPPSPSPPKPPAADSPAPSLVLPPEIVDRLNQLERQVEELRRREARSAPR